MTKATELLVTTEVFSEKMTKEHFAVQPEIFLEFPKAVSMTVQMSYDIGKKQPLLTRHIPHNIFMKWSVDLSRAMVPLPAHTWPQLLLAMLEDALPHRHRRLHRRLLQAVLAAAVAEVLFQILRGRFVHRPSVQSLGFHPMP